VQNLHHHRLNAVHSLVLLALRLLSPAGVFSLESLETVEKNISLYYHMGFAHIALTQYRTSR
jgi:NADH:ubiquinone oxidoreductase subunit 6 (subunit J)